MEKNELAAEVERAQANLDAGWYARREQHARSLGYSGVADALEALERISTPAAPVVDPITTINSASFPIPEGYEVREHLPGIWEYRFTDEDGTEMSSGTDWNNRAHASVGAWVSAYCALQDKSASTPAAPGIDLEQFRESVECLYSKRLSEYEDGQHSDADMQAYEVERRRLLSLIDASPKGGSTGPIIPEPHQECYSDNDGDSWYDHPADSMLVDGLAVGDTYTLSVSHYSVGRTYRVTKAPDETSDDYEVEPVQATSAEVGA